MFDHLRKFRLTFTLLTMGAFILSPVVFGYTDVSEDHKYYTAITYWTDEGVLEGYGEGIFDPESSTNRAEFLKIVMESNAIEIEKTEFSNCFSDVKEEWFAPYVCYAEDRGWIEGYSDGFFLPTQKVNRAEAAKIALEVSGIELITDQDNLFTDVNISSWYYDYAQTLGHKTLDFDEKFSPSSSFTRAQMAQIMYELLVEEESQDDAPNTEDEEVDIEALIQEIALEYEVPEWFLMAIVHRESTFDPNDVSEDDGIEGNENWNHQNFDCAFVEDGYPHGVGLTKLTGWMYHGSPYPYCLDEPDDDHEDYYYSMAMQNYGSWILMSEVSRLDDPFDPEQNLERFLTGYAVPASALFESLYDDDEEEHWRRVAYHWNKGLYVDYDPENTDYLELYDEYVQAYK